MKTKEQLLNQLDTTVEQMMDEKQSLPQVGHFGQLWMKYMAEQHPKKAMEMQLNNTFYEMAQKKNQQATEMKQNLIEQMKSQETMPTDLMERTQWENGIRLQAEETVRAEVILTPPSN